VTPRIRHALSLLVVLAGCFPAGREIDLLPPGYEGPVVIIYGDSSAPPLPVENGAVVNRIGRDGVLRTSNHAPPPGWYEWRYFYEGTDGTRTELPARLDDPTVLQAFAEATGGSALPGDAGERQWRAYHVGVPAKRPKWGEERERILRRVVRGAP
jgi:hypothetical protein